MAVGVAFTQTQPNGVVTNFVTILSVYWQPQQFANIQLGYYVSEANFLAGLQPVTTSYFQLNIAAIDPTQAMPPQIIAQCIAQSGPCPGGTVV